MTLAQALRDIADQLQTSIDGGDFALCFDHVRRDMIALPVALRNLADQAESEALAAQLRLEDESY